MPDPQEIIAGLARIARTMWPVALLWHVALALVLVGLSLGRFRPTRRSAVALSAVPSLSVASWAWLDGNAFNATLFGLLTLWSVTWSLSLPPTRVRPGPPWAFALGAATLGYAWVYPHFLEGQPFWLYTLASPVGLLPCPTLAMLVGLTLLGGGLSARVWAAGLALLGLFYAAFGIGYLDVWLDAGLGVASASLAVAVIGGRRASQRAPDAEAAVTGPCAERARIDAFLALPRIALVGASSRANHFSRVVMREFLSRGVDVVPVHPSAETIEGRPAFAGLELIEPPVDGVLVMTPREVSASVVEQCADLAIERVWLHRGAGPGAVSKDALAVAEERGLELIAGRCPLMFLGEPPALVHRAHAATLSLLGRYPSRANGTR